MKIQESQRELSENLQSSTQDAGVGGFGWDAEDFEAFKVFFAYLGEVLSSAEDPAEACAISGLTWEKARERKK